ncbi:pyruvate kinase 2, putative [Plasmodium berghei]|uniref:pyruvate kinase n=2 Tax=Plasmodium berghei TaxID=5821 RepID=A0A509AHB0_PLABA|nr:pyruvate kinase 2, putative [Plasmodium berghei ANKA]CXI12243.1 pyruvate kinase 2, putative [Plasmodium berghei]SCL93336.1 pyruvate kinase 2, putative [Plasmodium berghei]SCM15837.1 pyruvate kinase 2, putative [Plasmodium berghei]SCM17632.1 pyruvate kinase 2, putative [Plasmodium berghei]SCN23143.1 pyruvate kinase 2, putative [Plasmodium berghei]|eukprot:XP_034420441.1 pyruvate kinase 2, putative [Plasmodium berghei ANKA]
MRLSSFYLIAELITCFVYGLKNNSHLNNLDLHHTGDGLLFLNNAYINKTLENKRNRITAKMASGKKRNAIYSQNNFEDLQITNISNTNTKTNKISFTKCKQIATVGPSTEMFENLEKLYLSGIDVFRLNFSHGPKSIKKYIINAIRILEKKYNTSIGILGDIQGPKIRIGEFEKNEQNQIDDEKNTFVELKEGDTFSFDLSNNLGNKNRVFLNYPDLLKNIKPGQIILLDDGNLKMKVEGIAYSSDQDISVKATVLTGGKLYSKKGFCIPNMIMPIEVLSEKDIKDILFCINEGVDYLGYSFVQTEYDLIFLKNIINDYYESDFYKNIKKNRIVYDVNELQYKDYDDTTDFYIKEINDYYNNYYLKKYHTYKQIYNVYKNNNLDVGDMDQEMNDRDTHFEDANEVSGNSGESSSFSKKLDNEIYKYTLNKDVNKIFIISKIEKPSAVKNIDNIIKISDGIMIARGDLGIETNLSNLPILQKKIINLCKTKYNKIVIVATQMLESMRFIPSPTRAEVTDVATAIYDGADCVMLSAETATGKYPILSSSTQNSIIQNVEKDYYFYEYTQKKVENVNSNSISFVNTHNHLKQLGNISDISSEQQKKASSDTSHFDKLIYSIRDISNNINLKSIILFSNDFNKILKLSNLKTKAPIVVVTDNKHLSRKLQLAWGIYPYYSTIETGTNKDFISLINYGCQISKQEGFVNSPDEYSLVTFTENIKNSANLIYLCQPCLEN